MILLDSSVIVDLWRTKRGEVPQLLPGGEIVVCGVVWAEMLQGARSQDDDKKIRYRLSLFQQVPIPEAIWSELGVNLNILKRNGVTVPFPDVLLATVALHHDLELWTLDKHFVRVRDYLPQLRLYVTGT